MTSAALTAYLGLAVTVLGTILIPWAFRRRRERSSAAKADALSWEGMNRSLADREARLQKRLDAIDADYIDRIKTIRNDFEDQMQAERSRYEANLQEARGRIRELEQEVAVLQRIVGGGKA